MFNVGFWPKAVKSLVQRVIWLHNFQLIPRLINSFRSGPRILKLNIISRIPKIALILHTVRVARIRTWWVINKPIRLFFISIILVLSDERSGVRGSYVLGGQIFDVQPRAVHIERVIKGFFHKSLPHTLLFLQSLLPSWMTVLIW